MTITTDAGPLIVLHRLALAVECLDAWGNGLVPTPVRVGRQRPDGLARLADPAWPCTDLEDSGGARFTLRHQRPLPQQLVVRVDDPSRRYVPRRFLVHPWPVAALDEASGLAPLPARYRLLRAWLWPGSAHPLPRGTTVVRGQVAHGSAPVRWARIDAIGPTGDIAGRAHADDRGEFVLIVTDPAQNPLRGSLCRPRGRGRGPVASSTGSRGARRRRAARYRDATRLRRQHQRSTAGDCPDRRRTHPDR
jgi:hypothetical protein